MTPRKMFVPFYKIDEVRREVYGVIAEEAVDKKGEIFDYASSKPYVEEWSKELQRISGGVNFGNVRAMHPSGATAVGLLTGMAFDDEAKVVRVCAKIEDDAEWRKVASRVYNGFSLEGEYVRHWKDGTGRVRYTGRPYAVVLADNPAMYGATFTMIKTDGSEEVRQFTRPGDDGRKENGMAKAAKKAKAVKEGSSEAGKLMIDLKSFVADHGLLEGDPATWDFAGMAAAISGAVTKDGGATAPEEPAEEEVPAETMVEGAGAGVGVDEHAQDAGIEDVVNKAAEAKPEVVKKTAEAKPEAELKEEVLSLRKVVEAQSGLLKGFTAEAFAKTVSDAVAKAVEGPNEEIRGLKATIEGLKKTVEAIPSAVGRPVGKVLPGGIVIEDESKLSPDVMKKAIDAMSASGMLSSTSEAELRTGLAALEIRRTQAGQ